MRVIIAGSRSFADYDFLCQSMAKLGWSITEVVSGTARGADQLGERWAREQVIRAIPVKRFAPDWDKYGKRAGFIRNAQMVAYADAAVVFWDGVSKGSADTLARMRAAGKPVQIFMFEAAK